MLTAVIPFHTSKDPAPGEETRLPKPAPASPLRTDGDTAHLALRHVPAPGARSAAFLESSGKARREEGMKGDQQHLQLQRCSLPSILSSAWLSCFGSDL